MRNEKIDIRKDHGSIELGGDLRGRYGYWYNEDKTISITVTEVFVRTTFLVCFETDEGPIYQLEEIDIAETFSFRHKNKQVKITLLRQKMYSEVVFRLIEEILS